MGSIYINTIITIINKMWDEEGDLCALHSQDPKKKQSLSVRNMTKIVLGRRNLL